MVICKAGIGEDLENCQKLADFVAGAVVLLHLPDSALVGATADTKSLFGNGPAPLNPQLPLLHPKCCSSYKIALEKTVRQAASLPIHEERQNRRSERVGRGLSNRFSLGGGNSFVNLTNSVILKI